MQISSTLKRRYWAKVDIRGEDECWTWTHSTHRFGHGSIYFGKVDGRPRSEVASRVAWYLHHGVMPTLDVLHHCDNPPCQNPRHLFLGTQSDNVADMMAKGRNRQIGNEGGERHPLARLSEQEVSMIRRTYAAGGVYMRELAADYGVSTQQVSKIIAGKSWVFPVQSDTLVKGD